jgi:hypothetical protein
MQRDSWMSNITFLLNLLIQAKGTSTAALVREALMLQATCKQPFLSGITIYFSVIHIRIHFIVIETYNFEMFVSSLSNIRYLFSFFFFFFWWSWGLNSEPYFTWYLAMIS